MEVREARRGREEAKAREGSKGGEGMVGKKCMKRWESKGERERE